MRAALGALRVSQTPLPRKSYQGIAASLRFLTTEAAVSNARPTDASSVSTPKLDVALPSLADLYLKEGDNVVVAVSGGVDSSVTLRLLAELVS